MRTVQKFTYPTFMGICSILAAFADILQNQNIFVGMLVTLICLGAVALIVPPGWVSEKLTDTFGVDPSIKQALRPFGVSCFILGAMIYAFSAMSTQASDEGGALVASFPELKQVQLALGRVEQDVGEVKQQTVAIKQDTSELLGSAVKWLSVEASPGTFTRTTNAGEIHYFPKGFHVRLSNESGQIYEDISVVVSDGPKTILAESLPMMLQDGYKHYHHDVEQVYETITVCVAAKRRGRHDWVSETRVYQASQRRLQDMPDFDVISVKDQLVSEEKPTCSV